MKLLLRALNKFGAPLPFQSPSEVIVKFPYTTAEELEKSLTRGGVKILNAERGEFEVSLSDFEVQGLPVGENQNFFAEIFTGAKKLTVWFQRGLSVYTMENTEPMSEARKAVRLPHGGI